MIVDREQELTLIKCADDRNVHKHLNQLLLKYKELTAIRGLITDEKFSTIILSLLL